MVKEYNDNLFLNITDTIINEEDIKKELRINPFAKYLLYIIDNKIVGYLYYSDIYDRIEINQFEVKEEYRNKKIGTNLLKQLTETVDKSITLEVRKNNIYAIKLYNNFGFKEVAIRKNYYNGIDGILMERKN